MSRPSSVPEVLHSTLETSRLIIRFFDPNRASDYEDLLSIYRDPVVLARAGDRALTYPADIDVRIAGRSLPSSMIPKSSLPPPTYVYQLVYLKLPTSQGSAEFDDSRESSLPRSIIIGQVAVFRPPGIPVPQLGYAMKSGYYRQGYTTEAVREVLRYYSKELGLQKIQAMASPVNLASIGVMQKAGGRKVEKTKMECKEEGLKLSDEVREAVTYEWIFEQASVR